MDKPIKSGAPRLQSAERHQLKLRASSLDDLVSRDHPVRNVWIYVEKVDLAPLYAAIRAIEGGAGRPPIDPKILLALWLFATLEGVGSARELDRLTKEHQAYQWICGDVSVNYHTLADFRVEHPELLERLLITGVAVLTSKNLVTMERVAQDGMRIRASAGASSFHTRKTLEASLTEARAQVQRLREELHEDTAASTRRQRSAKERAAREAEAAVEEALRQVEEVQQVKARSTSQKKRSKEARSSTTDPDARVMKMANGGFNPAFNAQFATDVDSQCIIGVQVTNAGSDNTLMPPMIEHLINSYERAPATFLVDGGFTSSKAIDEVAALAPDCKVYGPVQAPKDASRSPYVRRKSDSSVVGEWRERMGTEPAKTIYKLRAQTAECVNALARNRGLYQFVVRGLQKVTAIVLWYALAHNFKRSVALARV